MLHRFLVRRFTRRARNIRRRRGTLRLRFPLLEKTVHFLRRLLFRSRPLLLVVVLLLRQIDNRRLFFFLFCATEFLNIFVQIRRRFCVCLLSSSGQVNRRRCFRDSLRVVDILNVIIIVRVRFLLLLFFRRKHRMHRRRLGRTFFFFFFQYHLSRSFTTQNCSRREKNNATTIRET